MTRHDAFQAIARERIDDPHLDVIAANGSLYAHGERFAYLRGSELALRLPTARAHDLVARNVAAQIVPAVDDASWVTVDDVADWSELASEAHQFAHGALPGRQS